MFAEDDRGTAGGDVGGGGGGERPYDDRHRGRCGPARASNGVLELVGVARLVRTDLATVSGGGAGARIPPRQPCPLTVDQYGPADRSAIAVGKDVIDRIPDIDGDGLS